MTSAPPRGVVGLLTAQALAFGVTLALLVIPANALFLDAYGSEWLPATYIARMALPASSSISAGLIAPSIIPISCAPMLLLKNGNGWNSMRRMSPANFCGNCEIMACASLLS